MGDVMHWLNDWPGIIVPIALGLTIGSIAGWNLATAFPARRKLTPTDDGTKKDGETR